MSGRTCELASCLHLLNFLLPSLPLCLSLLLSQTFLGTIRSRGQDGHTVGTPYYSLTPAVYNHDFSD